MKVNGGELQWTLIFTAFLVPTVYGYLMKHFKWLEQENHSESIQNEPANGSLHLYMYSVYTCSCIFIYLCSLEAWMEGCGLQQRGLMGSRVGVQGRGRGRGGGGGEREVWLWWGVWSLTPVHLVAHGNTSWWSRPTT